MMENAAKPRSGIALSRPIFSWSAVASWVLALIAGALIGSITTVLHQSTVKVAGVDVPWGLVVALAVVTAYILGLRLVRGERITVIFGALGVLVSVFGFSQRSLGGSVLVPNNLAGSIWAIAPTLIATVIVAWPKIPVRQAK